LSFARITSIHVPWRDELLPASFRGALFHVEAGSKESGRRIVVHEYPKKEVPYAEDMGRRVRVFNVRGYLITFPIDTEPSDTRDQSLYVRDYRIARNKLIEALESADGPGVLQLPTIDPIMVVNPQYRWLEEERSGGYCVFDMTFVEYGAAPGQPPPATGDVLKAQSLALKDRVQTVMLGLESELRAQSQIVPLQPQPPQQ